MCLICVSWFYKNQPTTEFSDITPYRNSHRVLYKFIKIFIPFMYNLYWALSYTLKHIMKNISFMYNTYQINFYF